MWSSDSDIRVANVDVPDKGVVEYRAYPSLVCWCRVASTDDLEVTKQDLIFRIHLYLVFDKAGHPHIECLTLTRLESHSYSIEPCRHLLDLRSVGDFYFALPDGLHSTSPLTEG